MTELKPVQSWQEEAALVTACRRCPRLVEYREQIAREKRRAYRDWDYWGKPVPAFGDPQARVMVIGLAPGAHGSNRTGRMFTGDSSGEFLYAALYRTGFANQPTGSRPDDGLALTGLMISAVCRCAPPDNKPSGDEILNCRPFLMAEMDLLPHKQGLVALGKIAFDNILAVYRQQGYAIPALEFAHGAFYRLGEGLPLGALPEGLPWLLASYHPSRQNTQTGRLTAEMFDSIWLRVKQLLA